MTLSTYVKRRKFYFAVKMSKVNLRSSFVQTWRYVFGLARRGSTIGFHLP